MSRAKYTHTDEIAAFIIAARKHGLKPTYEAFTAKFGDAGGCRIVQWRLLEALGEVVPRPREARVAPEDVQRRRAMKKLDKLQAQIAELQRKLAGS